MLPCDLIQTCYSAVDPLSARPISPDATLATRPSGEFGSSACIQNALITTCANGVRRCLSLSTPRRILCSR